MDLAIRSNREATVMMYISEILGKHNGENRALTPDVPLDTSEAGCWGVHRFLKKELSAYYTSRQGLV